MTRHHERLGAADGLLLVGGAALVGAAFVHWIARGPGSGLRGHELVDAIIAIGRHVPALSAARLTVLWYLVPALGAASWIAYGFTGRRSAVSRAIAVTALVVAVAAYLAFVRLAGADHLAWGPKLSVAGAVMLCAGTFLPVRAAEPRPELA